MTRRIRNNATPVGLAQPPIKPKSPGLVVKSHSVVVKLLLLITGSFTTTKAKDEISKDSIESIALTYKS